MIRLNVNGQDHEVDAEPDTPLLYVLRDELGLNGAKFGCGLGQCGACTVMVDGQAVFSCLMPLAALPGRNVRTIEGLGMNAGAARVHRGTGRAVRLLHRRHGDAGAGSAGAQPASIGGRNPIDHVGEPLPLRHAYAHSGRGTPSRRSMGPAQAVKS